MTSLLSDVDIANMALANIGERSNIESLTDQDDAEAIRVNLFYDQARRTVLEAFDWSFARTRLTLAPAGDDPPTDVWSYRYQYPEDCVSFREIVNINARPSGDHDPFPFTVELNCEGSARTILTNIQDAIGIYTKDITTPSLFTPFFTQTFSHLLSYFIAQPLTGKQRIRDRQLEIYNALIANAAAHNANEQQEPPPRDIEWIRAR